VDYVVFRSRPTPPHSSGFLAILMRLLAVAAVGIAMLAIVLVGLFVVLPLLFVGGTALYFYLRRRVRRAQSRPQDDIIDAEYTIVERPEP
jgi:membrane protein implicated in regulation of membrane protease activity